MLYNAGNVGHFVLSFKANWWGGEPYFFFAILDDDVN